MKNTAIFKGCDHKRCMFWFCELLVPAGYRIIKTGRTKQNDLILVPQGPFPKRTKSGTDKKIKGKWETVKREYIGVAVKRFRVVIRNSDSVNSVAKKGFEKR